MAVEIREPRYFETPRPVAEIQGPGDYKFEFTGRYPLIDIDIHTFLTRNFPGLSPLEFHPARLSDKGHYQPASLMPIEDWKRFNDYQPNYLVNQAFSDPEYYFIHAGGNSSRHRGSHRVFRIEDIGRLSIGDNKLKVKIDEPKGRDGSFQLVVSESGSEDRSYMDPRLVTGRVSVKGEHPGSLVRAVRAYTNLFAKQGATFFQER